MVVVVVLLLMVSIYQVLMMIEMRMLVNICKYPHMTTVVGSVHMSTYTWVSTWTGITPILSP